MTPSKEFCSFDGRASSRPGVVGKATLSETRARASAGARVPPDPISSLWGRLRSFPALSEGPSSRVKSPRPASFNLSSGGGWGQVGYTDREATRCPSPARAPAPWGSESGGGGASQQAL